ncbi:hypothetical protein Tco_1569780 [Tanacetum coccineum]
MYVLAKRFSSNCCQRVCVTSVFFSRGFLLLDFALPFLTGYGSNCEACDRKWVGESGGECGGEFEETPLGFAGIKKNGRGIKTNGQGIEKNDRGIGMNGRMMVAGEALFELAEKDDVLKILSNFRARSWRNSFWTIFLKASLFVEDDPTNLENMASGLGFYIFRMKVSGFAGNEKIGWGIEKNGWGIEKNGRMPV